MSHEFDPTVLREYDIRGIIGETLGPDDARAIGRGFGTLLVRDGGKKVAVGYDGRVSSPILEHALIEGLTASGCDVRRIGLGRVHDRQDVIAAHKRVVAAVHPDRGGSGEQVHEANRARDLLLAELPPRVEGSQE